MNTYKGLIQTNGIIKQMYSLLIPVLFLLLFGCSDGAKQTSTLQENISDLSKETLCPANYTFKSSFKDVWSAALRTLAKEENIKVLDKEAGIVVSEYRKVDDLELSEIDTDFRTQTGEYSYSLSLTKVARLKTDVFVNINLKMSQPATENSKQYVLQLKNILRKKIFISICRQLKPAQSLKCDDFLYGKKTFTTSSSSKQVGAVDTTLLQAQNILINKGYKPGPADGLMGKKTKIALQQFQKDARIAITGRPDQNTLIALGILEGDVKQSISVSDEVASPEVADAKSILKKEQNVKIVSEKNKKEAISTKSVKSGKPQQLSPADEAKDAAVKPADVVEKKSVTITGSPGKTKTVPPVTVSVLSENPEEKGLAIAREAEQRDNGFGDYTSDMIMILINKDGKESKRKIRNKVLEVPGDGDKGLFIFASPRDIKGTAFLTHSHKTGDDQWLYLPALKRIKRINARNKSGSFMGSEFSYEDISSQEVEKYSFKFLKDEKIGKQDCFVVEARPVDKKNSGYSKRIIWFDQKECRILKVEYYDRKGRHMKTSTATGFKQYLGKFWRPAEMYMVNHSNGKATRLRMKKYKFQVGLSAADFNQSSLKRGK